MDNKRGIYISYSWYLWLQNIAHTYGQAEAYKAFEYLFKDTNTNGIIPELEGQQFLSEWTPIEEVAR